MPRSKAFSPVIAAQQIADVFVARGFEAASLAQLEAASGLGKQSLYNAFGDKKSMYLQAVDCAAERFGRIRIEMDAAPNGRAALQTFFDQLVRDCASADPARHSCIVGAGLIEGIEDEDIRRRLNAKWEGTHALLRAVVMRGQRDGSVASRAPATELADHLMTAMSGLRVSARADATRARLKRIAKRMLAVLDFP